jgi:hypothetical protein
MASFAVRCFALEGLFWRWGSGDDCNQARFCILGCSGYTQPMGVRYGRRAPNVSDWEFPPHAGLTGVAVES